MSATDPICPPGTAFAAAVEAVRAGARNVQGAASELISRLSEPELLNLLDGDLTILRGLIGMSQRYN